MPPLPASQPPPGNKGLSIHAPSFSLICEAGSDLEFHLHCFPSRMHRVLKRILKEQYY